MINNRNVIILISIILLSVFIGRASDNIRDFVALSNDLEQRNQYDSILIVERNVQEMLIRENPIDSIALALSYYRLGRGYAHKNDFHNAGQYSLKAIRIFECLSINTSEYHARALINYALSQNKLQNFEIAYESATKAADIIGRLYEKKGKLYFTALRQKFLNGLNLSACSSENLANICSELINVGEAYAKEISKGSNYDEAIAIYEELLIYDKMVNYPEGRMQLPYLMNLIYLYKEMGRLDDAVNYMIAAIERWERQHLEPNSTYIAYLWNAAYYYQNDEKYEEAKKLYEKALVTLNKLEREDPSILSNLAICYYFCNESEKALEYALKSIEVTRRIDPQNLTALEFRECMLADIYHRLNRFDEAISILARNLDLTEGHAYYYSPSGWVNSMITLAICYRNTNDYAKCEQTYCEALVKARELGLWIQEADILWRLSELNHSLNQYKKSDDYIDMGLELYKLINRRPNEIYVKLSQTRVSNLKDIGKFVEAERLNDEIITLIEQQLDSDKELLAVSYDFKGSINRKLGNLAEAREFYQRALDIQKEIYGEHTKNYVFSLINMGSFLHEIGNYLESLEYLEVALNVLETIPYSKNLGILLNIMGNDYLALDRQEEAEKSYIRSLEILDSINMGKSLEYGRTAYNLSNFYFKFEKLDNVRKYLSISKHIVERILPETSPLMVRIVITEANLMSYMNPYKSAEIISDLLEKIDLNNFDTNVSMILFDELSQLYLRLSDSNKSLEMARRQYIKAIEIYEDKPAQEVICALINLFSAYESMYDYQNALHYAELAYDMGLKVYAGQESKLATLLLNLASCQYSVGDNETALNNARKAVEIRKTLFGENNLKTQAALFSYANCLSSNDKLLEAVEIMKRISDFFKSDGNYYNYGYLCAISNLSNYCLKIHDYENALAYSEEALEVYDSLTAKNERLLTYIFSNLSESLHKLGRDEEAFDYAEKSVENARIINGDKSVPYMLALLNEAEFIEDIEPEKSSVVAVMGSEMLRDWICSNFLFMTQVERNNYWDKYKNWFENETNRLAQQLASKEIIENGLNNTLFAKSLLLKSEIFFEKKLRHSTDEEVRQLSYELVNVRSKLLKYSKLDKEEEDSLAREALRMERKLLSKSHHYGNYISTLRIDWEKIKNSLEDNSLAVEFVTYKDRINPHKRYYMAYTFSKDTSTPIIINLFDSEELSRVKRGCYETPQLSELIWKKIEATFPGEVKNIYFSAIGDLHVLAIESLPDWRQPSNIIGKRIKMHRLSSLTMLDTSKSTSKFNESYIFGGIDYDYEQEVTKEPQTSYVVIPDMKGTTIEDSRGGVNYLPGTLEEVEKIYSILKKNNVNSTILTGKNGSEDAFRKLTGKRISSIHIASHGYYFMEQSERSINQSGINITESTKYICNVDKALSRTGLLFAGANVTLTKGSIDNENDGIITGQDISRLDLDGLDFVVLSACQTGMGEISGEGVSGLQRAFKKAGAGTLLLSLGKVDDQATQMLMTKFYEELFKGSSKFDALQIAQDYLRSYKEEIKINRHDDTDALKSRQNYNECDTDGFVIEKKIIYPFKNPKYWATFILLDAFD